MANLDSDLLRSFLTVAEAGSMTEGASRLLRTQSAVSLQIRRLEELLGKPVFTRHGRGVTLTGAGERLLAVAREVTTRLDATLRDLSADALRGRLRLGIPDDHSQGTLARIIAAFCQQHPEVELEVRCDLSAHFPLALERGALDLAVYEVETPTDPAAVLWSDPTSWVCARHRDLARADPLPVALFDRACWWRDAAMEALDRMGRPYRVVFSSQSVTGVTAAVEAGIAVALLGSGAISPAIRALTPDDGFPSMPCSQLVLASAGQATPARRSMEATIRAAFASDQDIAAHR